MHTLVWVEVFSTETTCEDQGNYHRIVYLHLYVYTYRVYIYICLYDVHVQTSRMYKQTVYKLPVGMLSPDTINHNSRDWNPVALHQGAAVLASANHVQILLLWWMHASEAGSFVRRKVSPRLVTSSGTWQLNRTSERMKFG